MTIKKTRLLLLAICMAAASISACGASTDGEDRPATDTSMQMVTEGLEAEDESANHEWWEDSDASEVPDASESSEKPEASDHPETQDETAETEMVDAEVYRNYSNLSSIKQFYGDLAVFVIKTYDNWGKEEYFGGCMDIEGNVIIQPNYTRLDLTDEPYMFGYDYMRDGSKRYYRANILDRQGNVIFSEYADQISDIGEVKNGCFYVEREEVTLSGNEYTKTYYSIHDLSIVSADEYTDEAENSHEQKWQDVASMEMYRDAYVAAVLIPDEENITGDCAAVILRSPDMVYFFATMDAEGNEVMAPQRNISFDATVSVFCKDLCPAKDEASGMWGYIDREGNWMIRPQYGSASRFDREGYAVVNDQIVINTKGEVILAPAALQGETVSVLVGRYERGEHYMQFRSDGSVKISNGYAYVDAQYQIVGGALMISGVEGASSLIPVQDGTYSFRVLEDGIMVDGDVWTAE